MGIKMHPLQKHKKNRIYACACVCVLRQNVRSPIKKIEKQWSMYSIASTVVRLRSAASVLWVRHVAG